MTQKELLYVEDAIGHEKNLINILNETLNYLVDDSLCNFVTKQISKREKILNNLNSMLEDKSNE